jgi:hypothetical protein
MKSKKIFSLFFITGVLLYALSFIATSREKEYVDDPCYLALQNRLNNDTAIANHAYYPYNLNNDTLILLADTLLPADWNKITDTICKVYKDNCPNSSNKPILIINRRDTFRSNWDTRYGRKILFKFCP